jgi:hypothetical protein
MAFGRAPRCLATTPGPPLAFSIPNRVAWWSMGFLKPQSLKAAGYHRHRAPPRAPPPRHQHQPPPAPTGAFVQGSPGR